MLNEEEFTSEEYADYLDDMDLKSPQKSPLNNCNPVSNWRNLIETEKKSGILILGKNLKTDEEKIDIVEETSKYVPKPAPWANIKIQKNTFKSIIEVEKKHIENVKKHVELEKRQTVPTKNCFYGTSCRRNFCKFNHVSK